MTALLDSLKAELSALPASIIDAQGAGAARREAMLETLTKGLPTQRDERWKYTTLRALSARSFVGSAATPQIHPAALADIPEPRIVFVNGVFEPGLSQISNLEAGLSVHTLSSVLAGKDVDDASAAQARELLTARFGAADEAFARLNSALAVEGALVQLTANSQIKQALHLVFVGAPAAADIASHTRNGIVLGQDSGLSIVEHHIANGSHRHLGNQLTDVKLGAGARLVHARLQDEDAGATMFARTNASLATGALYHRVDLELGAGLSRHELNVTLQGENAQVISGGAMLAGGRRHIDSQLRIEHVGRDTRCDLLWRGLATDRGRVAFHGGISILAGADGSDARLSNKNLLLSDTAEIDTQPVLQIHADEVKAAHGATIGQLDPVSLFYLRSRGIPAAQARVLLTLAFCREALATISDPALIALLSPRLEARLADLEQPA